MVYIQYQLSSASHCQVNAMSSYRWSFENELWELKSHRCTLKIKGRRSHLTRIEKRMSTEKKLSKPKKEYRKNIENGQPVEDLNLGNDHNTSKKAKTKSLNLVQRIVINIGGMKQKKSEETDDKEKQTESKIRLQVALGGLESEMEKPTQRSNNWGRRIALASKVAEELSRPLWLQNLDRSMFYRLFHPVDLDARNYDPSLALQYFASRPLLIASRILQGVGSVSGLVASASAEEAVLGIIAGAEDVVVAIRTFQGELKKTDSEKKRDDEVEDVQMEQVSPGWVTHYEKVFASSRAMRLKKTIMDLGPVAIKAAQTLGTRGDIISQVIADQLSELQENGPSLDRKVVVKALNSKPLRGKLVHMSPQPIASASLGQVHRGLTLDGAEVAVKIQRPNSLTFVALDIVLLRTILGAVRKLMRTSTDLQALADEIGQALYGELCYEQEAINIQIFRNAHSGIEFIKAPAVYTGLSSESILAMEWIEGQKLRHLMEKALKENDRRAAQDCIRMVELGVAAGVTQLFETGILHGDPHPGNLVFLPGDKLAFLDFGLVAIVQAQHRMAILSVLAHLLTEEFSFIVDDLDALEALPDKIDRSLLVQALEAEIAPLVREGSGSTFGPVARRLLSIARRFRLKLLPSHILIIRSLATLEGIALKVDKRFSIFKAAYPYVAAALLTSNMRGRRSLLRQLLLSPEGYVRWGRLSKLVRLHGMPEPKLRNMQAVSDHIKCVDRDSLLGLILEKRGSALRRVFLDADMTRLISDLLGPPRGCYEDQSNDEFDTLSAEERKMLLQGAIVFVSKTISSIMSSQWNEFVDWLGSLMIPRSREERQKRRLRLRGTQFQFRSRMKRGLWFSRIILSRLPPVQFPRQLYRAKVFAIFTTLFLRALWLSIMRGIRSSFESSRQYFLLWLRYRMRAKSKEKPLKVVVS